MLRNDPVNTRILDALGTLLFTQHSHNNYPNAGFTREIEFVSKLDVEQLRNLLKQAEMQRILSRTLAVLYEHLPRSPHSSIDELLSTAIAAENRRIDNVLTNLNQIVA